MYNNVIVHESSVYYSVWRLKGQLKWSRTLENQSSRWPHNKQNFFKFFFKANNLSKNTKCFSTPTMLLKHFQAYVLFL